MCEADTLDCIQLCDSIEVVLNQREKVEYDREKLPGVAIKNTQAEQILISWDFSLRLIFIRRQEFILNLVKTLSMVMSSEIKLVFSDKPLVLIFDHFPFLQDNLN